MHNMGLGMLRLGKHGKQHVLTFTIPTLKVNKCVLVEIAGFPSHYHRDLLWPHALFFATAGYENESSPVTEVETDSTFWTLKFVSHCVF